MMKAVSDSEEGDVITRNNLDEVVEDLEDGFVASRNYDFRFSREKLCDIKKGNIETPCSGRFARLSISTSALLVCQL